MVFGSTRNGKLLAQNKLDSYRPTIHRIRTEQKRNGLPFMVRVHFLSQLLQHLVEASQVEATKAILLKQHQIQLPLMCLPWTELPKVLHLLKEQVTKLQVRL